MMRRVLIALAAAAAVSATLAAAHAGAADAHFGCPGKDIHFAAADGTRLVAHHYGAGTTTIVLAHDAGANLCEWYPYVLRLASLGYSTLPFDFRRSGESQPVRGPRKYRWERDVLAAVELARSLGAKKVFVVGASVGAWAALVAASEAMPPVQGVVSLSAESQVLGDAVAAVRGLKAPVLYVASAGEGLADDAHALYDATASRDKTLKIVPGAAHGAALIDPVLNRRGYEAVRALLAAFFERHQR